MSRKPSLSGFTWGASRAVPAPVEQDEPIGLPGVQRAAVARAAALGHVMGAWRVEGGRTFAACTRCGAAVDVEALAMRLAIVEAVRANGGIVGRANGGVMPYAAGGALEACTS